MTNHQDFRKERDSAAVVILGAGVAGLTLGNLLQAAGVECVVLERATRDHVQTRARAGFLAPGTVRVLERHGLADGLRRRGLPHGTCEFRTADGAFRLDYSRLGRREQHTVYPQQDLVTDLLGHFLDGGGEVRFETTALGVEETDGPRPTVTVRDAEDRPGRWRARYVAGCDGRHGAARDSLPPTARRHRRDHGVTWLGLLAEAPPSLDAVGYALHERGFAGHMARTPEVTRYYLQCERGLAADAWSEERIWDELDERLYAPKLGPLLRGPIVQRGIIALESDVVEPLRHGSLLLAGDAAGLLSPTAAKGANLAVLEAELLAEALVEDLVHGDPGPLERYSQRCLRNIWRAQEFSHWMVQLLHAPSESGASGASGEEASYHAALRASRIEALRTSRPHQDWFAENYLGL
ncbi:4-hydroxybenzoate 3-monooxygenase [Kitasatospora sp. NPDC101183]|uniref:4-hydroxybenzoate 3-monooxygenase n=1 Tax=Kitasatospora sp. NPDC101183 TaxID=3364100 RepID=UPI0038059626